MSDFLHCHSRGTPCLRSIHQDKFYCGVKDPDFGVDGQERWVPNVLN